MIRHAKARPAFTHGRKASLSLVLVLAAFAALALAPAAPAADKGEVDRFGSAGTEPGQFEATRGIAINQQSGDVYVVDMGNASVNRPSLIERFESDGEFVDQFGMPAGGAAHGTDKGELGTISAAGPLGIAIDPDDGSVYVYDRRINRTQKFSPEGVFERMWGYGVKTGAAAFEVCTSADASCQAGIAGAGPGQFGSSTTGIETNIGSLAVDPDSGDVFVADATNRRINQYTSAGAFVRSWGWQVDTTATGDNRFEVCTTSCGPGLAATPANANGAFASNKPSRLTIDADGVLYASDSTDSNRVIRIDTDLVPGSPGDATATLLAPIGGGGAPLANSATTGLAIDSATGNLLVSKSDLIQELDTPAAPAPDVDFTHAQGEGYNMRAGVAVAPTGRLYASVDGPGRFVAILDTAAPAVATLNATTAVTINSAILHATIDPNGAKATYRFQYRPTGGGSFTSTAAKSLSGDGATAVTRSISGLTPGVTYEVQLLIEGYGPDQTVGADASGDFATPVSAPTIVERPAVPVTDTSALLQAQINPNNSATTYQFEWGTSAGVYPNKAPAVPASIGSGTESLVVFEQLTGLAPETTYHFRIVATNLSVGQAAGADQTFTTMAAPVPQGPGPERAYELVSPAYKEWGIGVGVPYGGPGALGVSGNPAQIGERFAVAGTWGTPLIDGGVSYANDWAFAERVSDSVGWRSHSPIKRAPTNDSFTTFYNMQTATSDMRTFVWRGNKALRLFPAQKDWPTSIHSSYVGDWEGRVEPIGPTDPAQIPSIVGSDRNFIAAISADGSHLVATAAANGLSGDPTDPTDPSWVADELIDGGRSVYLVDVSEGIEDSFPGDPADRRLLSVCTGEGAERTELPVHALDGSYEAQSCPAPLPGRNARLISSHGGSLRDSTAGEAPGSSEINLISADGTRGFFMSPDPLDPPGQTQPPRATGCKGTGADSLCPTQVYLWHEDEDGTLTTRWISRPEPSLLGEQEQSLLGAALFEGASADGDKVFFRTTSPLTADDPNGLDAPTPGGVKTGTASPDSWDLYMYDFTDSEADDPGAGELSRISAGPTGAGDCNNPQGETSGTAPLGAQPALTLRFASDDGERLLFACSSPLPGVPVPSNGTITAPAGMPTSTDATNLYFYDAKEAVAGRWSSVARVPRGFLGSDPNSCASTGTMRHSFLYANISGGISFDVPSVVWPNCVNGTADGSFITFWTRGRLTVDDPDTTSIDAYAFDAEADKLLRITAAQGGAGGAYPCGIAGEAASTPCHADPGPRTEGIAGLATKPTVPGERLAFFQSKSQLTPEDTDNAYDVYQWRNGELSLISTGESAAENGAIFRGNDETGRNVYFATRDALTWQDVDAVADVYVARVGGGIPEPEAPPLCGVLADACQGAQSGAPAPSHSSTASFQGEGNLTAKGGAANRCARLARKARAAARNAKRSRRAARRASGGARPNREADSNRRAGK